MLEITCTKSRRAAEITSREYNIVVPCVACLPNTERCSALTPIFAHQLMPVAFSECVEMRLPAAISSAKNFCKNRFPSKDDKYLEDQHGGTSPLGAGSIGAGCFDGNSRPVSLRMAMYSAAQFVPSMPRAGETMGRSLALTSADLAPLCH